MKYDVIISTYNGAQYLEEQLLSIISQNPCPENIYIRDDGSNDETLILLNKVKDSVPCYIEIIKGDNVGYIKSFEYLSKLTTSEVVFFADQDDVWLPNKARKILESLSLNSFQAVFSNAYVTDENLNIERMLINQSINIITISALLNRNFVTGATLAVKKEFLFSNCLPFLSGVPHDFQIGCLASDLNCLHFLNEPLIFYRQHSNNQIGASTSSFLARAINIFSKISTQRRASEISYRAKILDELKLYTVTPDEKKHIMLMNELYNSENVKYLLLFRVLFAFKFKRWRDLLVFYDVFIRLLNFK